MNTTIIAEMMKRYRRAHMHGVVGELQALLDDIEAIKVKCDLLSASLRKADDENERLRTALRVIACKVPYTSSDAAKWGWQGKYETLDQMFCDIRRIAREALEEK